MKRDTCLVIRIGFSFEGADDTDDEESVRPERQVADRKPRDSAPESGDTAPRPFHGRDTLPTEASASDDRGMSDAQKKALFRLAFALGDKDGALGRVLEALGVERLELATRTRASRAIDALKTKVARNNSGPSNGASHG
jgi:hypothetical protein